MAGKEGWGKSWFIYLFSSSLTFEKMPYLSCFLLTLFWGFLFFSKEKSQTAELWEKLNFGNKDQNVKFRKLMGIKVSRAVIFISFLYQIHNLQLFFFLLSYNLSNLNQMFCLCRVMMMWKLPNH